MVKSSNDGRNTKAFLRGLKLKGVKEVQAGFFKEAKYDDGTSVTYVAIRNEFGDDKLSERPFFRTAIKTVNPKIVSILKRKIDPRKMEISQALAGQIGIAIKDEIQAQITKYKVIKTGHLRLSTTYKVR